MNSHVFIPQKRDRKLNLIAEVYLQVSALTIEKIMYNRMSNPCDTRTFIKRTCHLTNVKLLSFVANVLITHKIAPTYLDLPLHV